MYGVATALRDNTYTHTYMYVRTLEGKEHFGEGRQSHQEMEHYATVGIVGAIVVGLGGIVGQTRGRYIGQVLVG